MSFEMKYGVVSEVKPGMVRVSFDEDEFVSNWLHVVVKRSKTDKESWQMEINEHVVCLMDEACEEGVCLGAIYNEEDKPDSGEAAGKFRKKFSDGTFIEYDKAAKKMTVDVVGTIVAKAAIKATVEAPLIELKGNVTVLGTLTAGAIATAPANGGSGNITIQGSVSVQGDVTAGTVSLKTHKHPGVQTGGGISGLAQ